MAPRPAGEIQSFAPPIAAKVRLLIRGIAAEACCESLAFGYYFGVSSGDKDIAARLAKLEAEFEEQNHQLTLATAIRERQARDLEAKTRENRILRIERDGYRDQFQKRSALLQVVLESKSFRVMQAMRRLAGRE